MAFVLIQINGQTVDFYDDSELPFFVTKQTDDLTKIGAGEGATAQNGFSQLQIPITKRNAAILGQSHIATSKNAPYRQKLSLNASIGGSVAFAGGCYLTNKIISGKYPQSYVLETTGDGLDVWEKLNGVSLRQIPMGSTDFTTANVLASQTGSPSAGDPVIYAPVLYGNTMGPNDPSPSYNGALFQTGDFRPAVYYKHIVKSIFEDYLGYSIESNFMDLEYFNRWVYMFGVGNQWRVASDVAKFRIELSANYTLPYVSGAYVNVRFNNIIYDPLGGWDAPNYQWIMPVTGKYRVSCGLAWSNIKTFRLIVQDVQPAPDIYGTYGSFYEVSNDNPGALSFDISFRAGCRVSVQVEPKNPSYTILAADSFLEVQLIDNVRVGTILDVKSLLHDRPVKDFIRGISHQFNLLWFVNTRLKKIYVEPRFDYYIPDPVFFIPTRYAGWYRSPQDVSPVPMRLDDDTIQLFVQDSWGKFLRLGYKQDDDPLRAFYTKEKNESFIPVDGIQIDFVDRGNDGTTEENPYFANLFLGYSNTTSSLEYALPCILPSGTDMEGAVFVTDSLGRIVGNLPDPTYESEPKCGMVYYGKTFVRHQETIAPWGSGALSSYALIMQSNNLKGNRGFTIFEEWSGGYGKNLRFIRYGEANPNASSGEELHGLASYFYYTYFACISEQLKLMAEFDLRTPKVSSENFRTLRYLSINNKQSLWILHKIQEFKPSSTELTKCELFPYREPTQELIDTIQYNDLEAAPFNHINIFAVL